MIQFYVPDIKATQTLPPEESAHAVRVLRKREGDTVYVTDGAGRRYTCRILSADAKRTPVEIVDCEEVAKYWEEKITLAVAPTKNMDRMEWLVEKAVEIGVDRIVLLRCEHSERKVVKADRLRKIAVSAMKQSLKAKLPEITEVTDFKTFVTECAAGERYMGYCDKSYPLKRLVEEYTPGPDVTILIGPEGDFSPAEVRLAADNGFVPVTFSEARLRTETAALYGLQTVHILDTVKCPGFHDQQTSN